MLPPIPTKLSQIDETTVSQHFLLAPTDVCYHIWEYTRRGGFTASPTNNLISNLKKKPSKIQTNPREAPWKEQAIGYCGQALQRMMNRPWIEGIGTLVPIPCSKIAGHPDHDDRLVTCIDEAIVGAGVRPQIMVFDDVLNSGKHFKVAQRLLAQRFPGTPIIGVFLARCLPDPPVEFDPLPDMDL